MVAQPIQHVIVLMLESRSFDHMLGLMKKVDGLCDDHGNIKPELTNSGIFPHGYKISVSAAGGAPWEIPVSEINTKGFGGPSDSFPSVNEQLYGPENGPIIKVLFESAPLNGFISNYLKTMTHGVYIRNPSPIDIAIPMLSFTEDQLQVLWQLASEFCVCDQWFSEVPGPAQPNHLFAHSATSHGSVRNVWNQSFEMMTIYEALEKVDLDWRMFYFDLNDSLIFSALKGKINKVLDFNEFYNYAQTGTLPSYSVIYPRYYDGKRSTERANSQHPPYDVRYGEHLIADVYESLRNSPSWEQSLLVVTYAGHGGFYDHVSPPTEISNPDGLNSPTRYDQAQANMNPREFGQLITDKYSFNFNRLGIRVPTLLISPWIAKGTILSKPLRHTSIISTLRSLFQVNFLTDRDKNAANFLEAVQLSSPRVDTPIKLNRPIYPLEETDKYLDQPLTERQIELWPMLSLLEGHPDSGKLVAPPSTRRKSSDYISERKEAHDRYSSKYLRKAS